MLYGDREWRQKVDLQNGDIYIGEWLVGSTVKQGRGAMIEKSGCIYEGYWHNNERSGKGRYIQPCGSFYTGNWKNGEKHGYGVLIYDDGESYEGEFEEGLII